ncbi:zinc-dependent alcohol dehydrogenase family protein [Patulibacter sp. SYSU D01012]|uniref:zinc-dependent alcohol dehydrogenase family protein n=1 Tax=Patulibacter sp. SYSU D01012 TaxID=2817381 RepID=UPI001B30D046|nr:zinc-dependent alcohol dehydrogenase family protein [Patulibacter sp. SYSU D01012]
MHATILHGPRDVRLEQVPDPELLAPTDAIVRVVAACVCGSDLWPYRGVKETTEPVRIGHEFVGIVEETGAEVRTVRPGQFVIAPFVFSDNSCVHCDHGIHTSCVNGGVFGAGPSRRDGRPIDGCQAEYVTVPQADGTLVGTDEVPDDALIPSLLTLSDVMATGHHAAVAARVAAGSTVAVVGDGAVGLSGVLAARRLGAERIVAFSRHEDRATLARDFGATDVVAARGKEGAKELKELLGGIGADAVLECVGTEESMAQALASARPGGMVGYVGVPHGDGGLSLARMFGTNVGVAGGVAPARAYIPELLGDVLDGTIDPGKVFDLQLPLGEVAEAYAAMDERRAIKTLLRP